MVFWILEVSEIDNNKLAREIIDLVGGTENVNSVTHCVTRLRFKLKNHDKADREALEEHEGVVTVREASGQFQVVIGNHVPDVYKAVVTEGGFKTEKQEQEDEDRDDEKKGLLTASSTSSQIYSCRFSRCLWPPVLSKGSIRCLSPSAG